MHITTRKLAAAAVTGAAYAALTMLLAPISYGAIQCRVSEVLCILPFFIPCTAWGLFAGCAIANLLSAAGIFDVIFGSLATLLAALCTAWLGRGRGAQSWVRCILAALMPVVFNFVFVGAVLTWSLTDAVFPHLNASFWVFGGQVAVELDALLLLEFVQNRLEFVLRDFHNHVREHGDETAIRVIREMRVVGQVRQTHNRHVRQAQIQNGIHHAGHGGTSAGADRNKERILVVAELLAGHLFGLRQSSINLLDDIVTNHLAVGIIPGAGFGGDGEALRHRQTYVGHLCKVCTLAAKQLAHVAVAFGEQVYILVRHTSITPFSSLRVPFSILMLHF